MAKTYQIEKGHLYFVGEFSGTFFNDKGKDSLFDRAGGKCPAFYDIDLNNKKGKAGGYCVVSDAPGDQALLQQPSNEFWVGRTWIKKDACLVPGRSMGGL